MNTDTLLFWILVILTSIPLVTAISGMWAANFEVSMFSTVILISVGCLGWGIAGDLHLFNEKTCEVPVSVHVETFGVSLTRENVEVLRYAVNEFPFVCAWLKDKTNAVLVYTTSENLYKGIRTNLPTLKTN
jgi:hypothetical protein